MLDNFGLGARISWFKIDRKSLRCVLYSAKLLDLMPIHFGAFGSQNVRWINLETCDFGRNKALEGVEKVEG